jgi:serine/threonine protein kinase
MNIILPSLSQLINTMSINLYPIIKQLGEGGFGTTYLATNTLMPSRPYCVVKQLVPTSNDPRIQQLIQERFRQEAIVLENLSKGSNGRIPTLYHYFVEQGEFYLVQEHVDGQTLTDKVRERGKFTELQVRQLLTDLLPTLSYVHQKGIIHRDIKPDNIMVRYSDEKPILIDFGAVKEIMGTVMTASENTGRSIVIGTPGFMPVEQMSGRPAYASDIYALGLTAIYLLTGKMPQEIETDSHSGNVNWQVYAQNISPQLKEVLNKSIQPVLSYRYSNAQEMLQALNNPVATQVPIGQNQGGTTTVVVPIHNNDREQYPNPQQQYQQQYTPNNQKGNTQTNPILMAIIGVIVGGGLIAGGLVLANILSPKPPVVVQSPPVIPPATTAQTPVTTTQPTATPTTQPTITPTPTSTSSISQGDAENTIKQWLQYKRVLFAPPYDKQPSADLLTERAYINNISRASEPCANSNPDDCLSSVDWLQRYNAQYSFGVQSLDRVDKFEASGDRGSIFVTITERRTLHKTGGRSTPSGGTSQVRYDLKFENGKVKISDYK